MNKEEILKKLEELGKERTKEMYIKNGAKEPVYGVPVGHLKGIVEVTPKNQNLANELFNSSIFEAMYLAGILAEPLSMTKENFEDWIEKAYAPMLSDVSVAVTLAESPLATEIADEWLKSDKIHYRTSAWATYQWILKSVEDDKINKGKIEKLLDFAVENLYKEDEKVYGWISDFIATVGTNYMPLHEEAKAAAEKIIEIGRPLKKRPTASDKIKIDTLKNKLGMKKQIPRC